MRPSADVTPVETIAVHYASARVLAGYLNPQIPWVWIIGHQPQSQTQWWMATVPLNERGDMLTGEVRLLAYDAQLSTTQFLARVDAFEEHGLLLIQSRLRMPNTLDLSNLGSKRQSILRTNGAFLSIELPHAGETAVVTCYEPGYLARFVDT